MAHPGHPVTRAPTPGRRCTLAFAEVAQRGRTVRASITSPGGERATTERVALLPGVAFVRLRHPLDLEVDRQTGQLADVSGEGEVEQRGEPLGGAVHEGVVVVVGQDQAQVHV